MKKNVIISAAQAVEGMQATLRNAEAFLQEAMILSDAGHGARATALAILAYEELGKILYYANAHSYASRGQMGQWWKMFSCHTDKIAAQDLATLAVTLNDIDPTLIAPFVVGDTARFFNEIKMKALYTDFDGDSFVCPLDNEDVLMRHEALIRYVETSIQLYRGLVTKLTPESLEAHWKDSIAQERVDNQTRAFENEVARRWVSDKYMPPKGSGGAEPSPEESV